MPVIKSFVTDKKLYRPDIDGLRAIAVLSVILFHINKSLLPGGFVGVDIFFVISGFLISRNIIQDLDKGRFSIADFYRRRIKRIMPALLVVVFVTLLLTQTLFIPEDAHGVARSALWSLSSLANVYFWRHQDAGYFAAASSQKPLLHLWSLGVEEQFYILWPPLLMLVYRRFRTRSLFVAATVLAIASFLLGEFLFHREPSFVYYMLPTRAGELLLGALAALLLFKRTEPVSTEKITTPLAILGLLLLGASCFLLSEDSVFPGIRAVPPTLGAALLILTGHNSRNWVSRFLAFRPLVATGLISYSAYLWHWPLLACFRYGYGHIGLFAGSVLFALTLTLAWVSYTYVEQPARASQAPAMQIALRQYVLPAAALTILSFAALNLHGYGFRRFSDSYTTKLDKLRLQTRAIFQYDYVCLNMQPTQKDVIDERCVVGAKSVAAPQAILWGDSNAAHYIGVLGAFARKEGFRFRNLETGSCPPLSSDPKDFVKAVRLQDCRNALKLARPAVEAYPVVVISASWTDYQERSGKFLDAFFATALALAQRGKTVIVIGKAPVIPDYDRRCREKALSYPFLNCRASDKPLSKEVADVNASLKAFAERTPNVEYYDMTSYFCHQGVCSAYDANDTPRYYDTFHLSLPASWDLGSEIIAHDGVPFPFTLIRGNSQRTMISVAATRNQPRAITFQTKDLDRGERHALQLSR